MDEQAPRTEPPGVAAAMSRAPSDGGMAIAMGGLIAWAATAIGARSAVEVGSANGVSGLWLVDALAGRGALTSVEPDPHRHSLATQAYEEAGVSNRIRTILGDPDTVLDRLSDAAYDLVLLQLGPVPNAAHLSHAARLLRVGGAVVVRSQDPEGTADALRQRTEFGAVVALPLGGGIVLASRIEESEDV